MKRFFEPIIGFVLTIVSWDAWDDLLVSLIVAFLGGMLAYLGKWLCARAVAYFTTKKTLLRSKVRDIENLEID